MEYFKFYDPLPAIFISVGVVICSILIFEFSRYLRGIIPKSVECWFCKYKTEVDYSIQNSWTCPSCEQYNGFTKDGDYNKVIASHHNESLNLSSVVRQVPRNEWKKTTSLCNKCNLKQQLKVQQLASFVPMIERNYDKEIEHFREQIEKNYELCENCEMLVNKVLQSLREELSLPKRLYSVISQVKIRGETAVYINILLSSVLAASSLQGKISLPAEVGAYVNDIQKYMYFLDSYPSFVKILNYWMQLVIATGFLVNSIGYYQTKSLGVFLNSSSWVLMFFLTLYPAQYEEYVTVLKVLSGVISVAISIVILLKNYEQRSKSKKTLWERRSAQIPTTPTMFHGTSSFPNITRSPSNSNISATSLKYSLKVPKHSLNEENMNIRVNSSSKSIFKTKHTPNDEGHNNINFGISNLNIGQKDRKETKQQNSKPLITPPKFNPFSGTRSCYMTNDKNYPWKPSTSFTQYEPSVTPSVYDSYEPSVAALTSFGCPCYPSCSPTLAYYFSAQNFPKPSVIHTSTPVSQDQDIKNHNKWAVIYSLPVIFLICCNIFLLCIVYNKETTSLKA